MTEKMQLTNLKKSKKCHDIKNFNSNDTNHKTEVPFILVGTKVDMRNDANEIERLRSQGQSMITTEQGNELAKKLKAVKYMECSAKTQAGLKDVFDEAVKTVLLPQKKKSRCTIV